METTSNSPIVIQQINFTAKLYRAGKTAMFSIIEEAKETTLDFSQETEVVLCIYLTLINY